MVVVVAAAAAVVVALVAETRTAETLITPTMRHKEHKVNPVHRIVKLLLPPMVPIRMLHVSVPLHFRPKRFGVANLLL